MWHKPCRTFHPWCLCIKTRCLSHIVKKICLYWKWPARPRASASMWYLINYIPNTRRVNFSVIIYICQLIACWIIIGWDPHQSILLIQSITLLKDLSMMWAGCVVHCEIGGTKRSRGSVSADVSEWPLSAPDLTMHDTSCLNPIMTWIIWFWYITKPKFASEVPKREVANHAL